MRSRFHDYQSSYPHARLTRSEDGVVEVTLHTGGESLRWNLDVHEELGNLFRDLANDRDNEVVILTGAGSHFTLPDAEAFSKLPPTDRERWDEIMLHAKDLMANYLDIQVPVISILNGPSGIHAELACLGDIVLASTEASAADMGHFVYGIVPGDGVHVAWPMLIGLNHARRFLLLGETLSASELQDLGVVAEILERDQLMMRARELAETLLRQPRLTRRYTRQVLVGELRRRMLGELPLGLALEGITDLKAI